MGEVKGFLKYDRQDFNKQAIEERLKHWKEFTQLLPEGDLQNQGARCMDCGVPFCHWSCPVSNIIPDFNDLVYQGQWKDALTRLLKTNHFPEFTGRICPAPCENSCVLAINEPAVTIKNIELYIIEKAFKEGWVKANPPKKRIDKKIAVIGSGPAGLACAYQLNKIGYEVTVFEKNEEIGGLLTLGIPDFKLEKLIVKRRVDLMKKEGIVFRTDVNVGVDISADKIKKEFDTIVLACGAEDRRDLLVPGRELKGIYQAMEYLPQQNRINRGQKIDQSSRIDAKDKNVIVLGGGDTGADCVGTANRQGAKSVKQFELLPKPPSDRAADNPWPEWAYIYRRGSSHDEGVEQDFCVMTKSFSGEKGALKKLQAVRLEFGEKDPKTGRRPMKEIPGSEFEVECDLVFLAMGFLGPVKKGLLEKIGVELDNRGNVKTDNNYMTSVKNVFAAGDMRTGQSLVVKVINDGRKAAQAVDNYFKNNV